MKDKEKKPTAGKLLIADIKSFPDKVIKVMSRIANFAMPIIIPIFYMGTGLIIFTLGIGVLPYVVEKMVASDIDRIAGGIALTSMLIIFTAWGIFFIYLGVAVATEETRAVAPGVKE